MLTFIGDKPLPNHIFTFNRAIMTKCHVVVGGGPSAILLCIKLLEKDDVILIERGGFDSLAQYNDRFGDPLHWPCSLVTPATQDEAKSPPEQNNLTDEQAALSHRHVLYREGNGVGGATNINAMILSAGHPAVYDQHWPKQWSSHEINR